VETITMTVLVARAKKKKLTDSHNGSKAGPCGLDLFLFLLFFTLFSFFLLDVPSPWYFPKEDVS